LLEAPIESEMLPDEAEPALEADEVKLVAWVGAAQASAKAARHRAREKVLVFIGGLFVV
jgi:hypothetical protein